MTTLERAIAGALRATIKDHGPITAEHIGSAVKRIVGQLGNADLGGLSASDLARKRWAGTTALERSKALSPIAARGGRTAWAGMTEEERSAEMKRRAATRKKQRGAGR